MIVRDLIKRLVEYNMEAEVKIPKAANEAKEENEEFIDELEYTEISNVVAAKYNGYKYLEIQIY